MINVLLPIIYSILPFDLCLIPMDLCHNSNPNILKNKLFPFTKYYFLSFYIYIYIYIYMDYYYYYYFFSGCTKLNFTCTAKIRITKQELL